MEKVLKEKDYIDVKYKNLYSRVTLVPMGFGKFLFYTPLALGFVFLIFVYLACSSDSVKLLVGKYIEPYLYFQGLVILILGIRVNIIYLNSKPWKFGAEYSIYVLFSTFLFWINCFIVTLILNYSVASDIVWILLLIAAMIVGYVFFFLNTRERKKGGERVRHRESSFSIENMHKSNNYTSSAIITITPLLYIFYRIFPNSNFDIIMLSLSALFFYILLSFLLVPFVLSIYAWFYREGVDLAVYYAFVDGINPDKEYPPNFGYVSPRKKRQQIKKKIKEAEQRGEKIVVKRAVVKGAGITIGWAPHMYENEINAIEMEDTIEQDEILFQQLLEKIEENGENYENKVSFELESLTGLGYNESIMRFFFINDTEKHVENIVFEINVSHPEMGKTYLELTGVFEDQLEIRIPPKTAYYYMLEVKTIENVDRNFTYTADRLQIASSIISYYTVTFDEESL